MLHGAHSFDDLRLKLIFFEQQSKSTQDRDVPTHQAFAATIGHLDSGAQALLGHLILIIRARTMAVVISIKGTRVDIPRTTIGTPIVKIHINQVLLGVCLQVSFYAIMLFHCLILAVLSLLVLIFRLQVVIKVKEL